MWGLGGLLPQKTLVRRSLAVITVLIFIAAVAATAIPSMFVVAVAIEAAIVVAVDLK